MISVIGAGPAGSYAASLLAKDYDVNLYEDHNKIGIPFQCTGILTSAIEDIIKLPKRLVLNKLSKVKLYSPKGASFEINLKKPDLVIDRIGFDQYIAELAVKNGAKLHYNHRLIGLQDNKLKFKDKFVETDYIIGADGPMSTVAKSAGLFGKRQFFLGRQFQARLKEPIPKDTFEVYFGAAPDFFAWAVPENEELVRIGIATVGNVNACFDKFILPRVRGSICGCQAGLIPVYNPKLKTSKDNIFLIGDAATQVKASTAGGIIQGMQAAGYADQAIRENKDYEKLWRKTLGKELYLHLMIKKVLYNFKDEEYEKLLSILKDELGNFNRDNALKGITALLFRKPSFSLFLASKAKYLYR